MTKHKRAPNGYRVVRWSDGVYHIYRNGTCIDEVLSKSKAIDIALKDKCAQSIIDEGLNILEETELESDEQKR